MKKIADISKWQGDVNWEKAATELDFAILRASCGQDILDTKYLRNVDGCVKNNVPFGAYHYVKAGTAEAARTEARFFLQCVEKAARKPNFYIADIEYKAQNQKTTEAVCVAFLEELRTLGLEKIGLYINTRYKWAGKAIAMCDIMWTPHWGKNDGSVPADKYKPSNPHDIWQYTSKGSLAGVKGRVDLNQLSGRKPLSYFTGVELPQTEPAPDAEEGETTMSYDPNKVIELAKSEEGYLEKASNSQLDSKTANAGSKNYTKYARDMDAISGFYNGRKQAVAWCDVFVDWLFVTAYGVDAALKLLCQPKKSCGAGCRYSRNYYKAKGQLFDVPKPGDQIFFWPSSRSDPNAVAHTGLVYAVDSKKVYTIEGNTSSASGVVANGGCVRRKEYALTYARIAGYGRPNYGQEIAPTEPVNPVKLGERTLSKGDEGSDVSELQTALVKLGYNLGTYGAKKDGVDGDFGNMTKKAVMSLQEKHNLTETGIFDTAAYNALLEDLNPEPAPVEEPGDDTPRTVYILTIYSEDVAALKAIQTEHGGTITETEAVG